MRESDVILAPLFQADEELKYRPAIILRVMPLPYRDLLVCGVRMKCHRLFRPVAKRLRDRLSSMKDSSELPEETKERAIKLFQEIRKAFGEVS